MLKKYLLDTLRIEITLKESRGEQIQHDTQVKVKQWESQSFIDHSFCAFAKNALKDISETRNIYKIANLKIKQ